MQVNKTGNQCKKARLKKFAHTNGFPIQCCLFLLRMSLVFDWTICFFIQIILDGLSCYLIFLYMIKTIQCCFVSVSESEMQKTVGTLQASLTRIRNELKHHDNPKSPDDKFGEIMSVSFSNFISKCYCLFDSTFPIQISP